MAIRTRTIDDFSAEEIRAMPKSARPIGVRPLSEKDILNKYASRVRVGKTAKSRKH